jgi:hypothetical protein
MFLHFPKQASSPSLFSDTQQMLLLVPSYWLWIGPSEYLVKVKCTLVQALRLCTGRTAHRGSRGIALLYRH